MPITPQGVLFACRNSLEFLFALVSGCHVVDGAFATRRKVARASTSRQDGLPAAPAPRRKRASAADTAAIKASFRSIEFPQKGEIVE